MKVVLDGLTKIFPPRIGKGKGVTAVKDFTFVIPDGTLVVFDPMKDSGGSAEYDPSRDLHDMEIIIGDWWSGDVDLPPSTYEENVRADYLTEMMERHHFTIARPERAHARDSAHRRRDAAAGRKRAGRGRGVGSGPL